jgi:glyoxalase family protein
LQENAQRNHDFYTKVLGLRLVKKTVNFDDPGTYHFYFGDERGEPGTILTFFPWEGVRRGSTGTGMATEISYSVPPRSLPFWKERFVKFKVKHSDISQRFGEAYLSFEDPDGLIINLVVPSIADGRKGWTTTEVPLTAALKGFHGITLTLRSTRGTEAVLTNVFGYTLQQKEGNRHRYVTNAVSSAAIVDIIESPDEAAGIVAGGTNHHVAFRVKDEDRLMLFRDKISRLGLSITPKIDRNYFYSLYFREPGGVLFEIATDNPGFDIDEPIAQLGTHLKLPAQYESSRKQIEEILPVLD